MQTAANYVTNEVVVVDELLVVSALVQGHSDLDVSALLMLRILMGSKNAKSLLSLAPGRGPDDREGPVGGPDVGLG